MTKGFGYRGKTGWAYWLVWLRGDPWRFHARCIRPGEEFDGELALAIGELLVAKAGGGVYQGDVGVGDAADGGIEDGSVDGPG